MSEEKEKIRNKEESIMKEKSRGQKHATFNLHPSNKSDVLSHVRVDPVLTPFTTPLGPA